MTKKKVNRKKELRQNFKKRIKTHIVNDIQSILFRDIHLHYDTASDDFICQLTCFVNKVELRINGYIYATSICDHKIKIKTPTHMFNRQNNCMELVFLENDVPNFYTQVKQYVDTIGDYIDQSLAPFDMNFQSTIGIKDDKIKLEKENIHVQ